MRSFDIAFVAAAVATVGILILLSWLRRRRQRLAVEVLAADADDYVMITTAAMSLATRLGSDYEERLYALAAQFMVAQDRHGHKLLDLQAMTKAAKLLDPDADVFDF